MSPTKIEVERARELISRHLGTTRVLRAESLERRSGARVLIKMETDLPTHSFKPRGALTALLTNAEKNPLKGVAAASTGNHSAAVAYAAKLVGIPATIFLPNNPNSVKREK